MRLSVLLILFSLLAIESQAQRWKAERHTLLVGIGFNNFMGDLGGGAGNAAHFLGAGDIDFSGTRPVIQLGYRYRVMNPLYLRINASYALLSATDDASGSSGRLSRNLQFRSNIWEVAGQVEYAFIKERESPRYSFSTLGSIRNLSAYAFIGFGFFYFSPEGKLDGRWYDLKPLKTEGEGLDIIYSYKNSPQNQIQVYKTPAEYSNVAFVFPVGLGVKYNFNRKIGLSLEISNRFTTTDYIDDVSDKYFNYKNIPQEYWTNNFNLSADEVALRQNFADRHVNEDGSVAVPYLSGKAKRGNPKYNDAYLFTVVTLHYKIKNNTQGAPKF